jgi:hypothetical protein
MSPEPKYAWFLSSIADEVGNPFLRSQVQRVSWDHI